MLDLSVSAFCLLMLRLPFKSVFLFGLSVFLPVVALPGMIPVITSNLDLFKFFPGISPIIVSYLGILFSVFIFKLLLISGSFLLISPFFSFFLLSGIIYSLFGSNL